MYFIGKLENGYLQLVRIIFLVLATLALIIAVVVGVPAVIDYNAKPAPVPSDISVGASAFRLETKETSSEETRSDATATPTSPEDKAKAALLGGFHAVLLNHGKKLVGADFTLDRDSLQSLVDSWADDPDRGADYVKAQTKYIDEVLSRADVTKQVHGSRDEFFDVVNSGLTQFRTAWESQREAIAAKKTAAEEEATAKRIGAIQSISVVGGALGLFITLVLSLIMFRVDRSIRQMANARVGG